MVFRGPIGDQSQFKFPHDHACFFLDLNPPSRIWPDLHAWPFFPVESGKRMASGSQSYAEALQPRQWHAANQGSSSPSNPVQTCVRPFDLSGLCLGALYSGWCADAGSSANDLLCAVGALPMASTLFLRAACMFDRCFLGVGEVVKNRVCGLRPSLTACAL